MEPDLEALVAEFLGPRYAGRRFLRYAELEELGLVDNRATLDLWMRKGAFPRGLKVPGPYGKTLVWPVLELVRLIAQRLAERDASPENEEGAPARGRPADSDSPLAAGRNTEEQRGWIYDPPPT